MLLQELIHVSGTRKLLAIDIMIYCLIHLPPQT